MPEGAEANLTWKLDQVLSGNAPDALLDTYTTERRRHLQNAIEASLYLGRIICEPDPAKAAERDARIIAENRQGGSGSPLSGLMPPQDLTEGLLRRDANGARPAPAGQLSRQGRVLFQGREGLFDQVVGTGFTLLADRDPRGLLDENRRSWCERVGVRLLRVTGDRAADGEADVIDLDGTYTSYWAETGQVALLIRPDYYIFGGATCPDDMPGLVTALREAITRPADRSEPAGAPRGLH